MLRILITSMAIQTRMKRVWIIRIERLFRRRRVRPVFFFELFLPVSVNHEGVSLGFSGVGDTEV
jgi:hypothetical protein